MFLAQKISRWASRWLWREVDAEHPARVWFNGIEVTSVARWARVFRLPHVPFPGEIERVKSTFISHAGGALRIRPDRNGRVSWIRKRGTVRWVPARRRTSTVKRPEARRASRAGLLAWISGRGGDRR